MTIRTLTRHTRESTRYAQTMIDYIILLVIVVATLLVMGYYMRNSIAGKWRRTSEQYGKGEVYAPQITAEKSTIEFSWQNPTPP
ncbi:hypothetical protein ACFL1E_07800 [Candidatus Omnitrophota bacterium]